MSSIILDKPSKTTWIKPVEKEHVKPKKLWELYLVIPDKKTSVFGRTTLKTVPETGLFSERVKMTIWTTTTSPGDFGLETDVDGMRFSDTLDMQVHIFGSSIRFSPMRCEGDLSCDGTSYAGSWTMPCMNPSSCGCDGLTGTFSLREL